MYIKSEEKMITRWPHNSKEKVSLVNLGILIKFKYVKINMNTSSDIKITTILLLHEYWDIFALSHDDLKKISMEIVEYWIDLISNAMLIQQK